MTFQNMKLIWEYDFGDRQPIKQGCTAMIRPNALEWKRPNPEQVLDLVNSIAERLDMPWWTIAKVVGIPRRRLYHLTDTLEPREIRYTEWFALHCLLQSIANEANRKLMESMNIERNVTRT